MKDLNIHLRSFLHTLKHTFVHTFLHTLKHTFVHTFTGSSLNAKPECSLFRCNAVLSIPHIVMQPGLDEVQQSVNRAVQCVLSVFKAVAQWGKGVQKDPRAQSAASVTTDGAFERRPSVRSVASESFHSEGDEKSSK